MDNKFKIFVIIALVVLAIVAGASTFIAINVMNKTSLQAAQNDSEQAQKVDPENLELISLGDAITANIVDEMNNPHVVRVVLSFEIDAKSKEYKEFNENFTAKQVMIRDSIIYILRQQTYEMMSRQDAQEKLADQVVTTINELLGTTIIQNVYFGEFFVQ